MLLQGNQFDNEIQKTMLYTISASTNKKSNIDYKNKSIVNIKDYLDNLTGSS